ncbi:MAG: hypothetical protein L3J74_02765 [Bacteroidales bacterium]|nr:hypothetical protein [Bacteroidales bacterium]
MNPHYTNQPNLLLHAKDMLRKLILQGKLKKVNFLYLYNTNVEDLGNLKEVNKIYLSKDTKLNKNDIEKFKNKIIWVN